MTTVTSTGDATIYTVPTATTTIVKTAWAYNDSGGAAKISLKMNLISLTEREEYLKVFKKEMKDKRLSDIDIILCPSFTHIEAFGKNINVLCKKVSKLTVIENYIPLEKIQII